MTDSTPDDLRPPARKEVMRSKNLEELEVTAKLLGEAGIACRVSTNKAGFEYSDLGHGDVPPDAILTVAWEDFRAARDKLEATYAAESLPEGHFLTTASDEDILAILIEADDWSAFDVAQARKLASERGMDLSQKTALEAEKRKILESGVPAPDWLIVVGWLLAFVGGIAGIGIGYRLAFWTEESSLGKFYCYDQKSRETGAWVMAVGLVMVVVWRFVLVMLQ